MALILLYFVYLGLAVALAGLAGWLGRPWESRGGRWPLLVVLVLTLLPLCFTGRGFLPGTTLSPTPMLRGVPPWAEPERVERMEAEATANPLLLDPLVQFLPWREAARRDLLFNPAQGGGAALLANGQSAVLYPTEVMARWLTPFRATTFSQAARLLVAGWGMFLLATTLLTAPTVPRAGPPVGRNPRRGGFADLPPIHGAGLAAAGVWMGCGFVQVWRLHPHTLVAATVPWVLLALVRLARRPGPRSALGLTVVGAVAVAAGHPETLLHAVLFGLLLLALVLWSDRHPETPGGVAPGAPAAGGRRRLGVWGRVVAWGAVAAVLSALLAAPLLLPFVENLRVSSEWVLRRDSGTVVEVPLAESLQRLRPTFALYSLGDPRVEAGGETEVADTAAVADGAAVADEAVVTDEAAERGSDATDSWLDPWAAPWSGPENLSELAGGWVGAVALLLVALALGDPSPRRRRLVGGLVVVGLLGLLVSVHLMWLSRPFAEIPLLRESLLKRLSLWWALSASLLAGFGLARWLEGRILFFRPPLFAWAAAAIAVSLAAGGPFRAAAAVTLWEWLPLLLAAGALLAVPWLGDASPKRRRVERAAVALVFVALLAPPVVLFGGWVPAVGSAGFYPETLATRFVDGRLAEAGPLGYRVAGLEAALVPHSASFFGYGEARAYDPMTFAPYAEFMAHAGESMATGWTRLTDPATPPLAFLGVRYVFEHPSAGERDGVEIAFRGHGGMVYENPRALPRVYVPGRLETYPTPQEAVAAAGRISDFAEWVTVSGMPSTGEIPGQPMTNGTARVTALEVVPRRVTATVVAEEPSLVASSQPAIPGWRLRMDGEEASAVAVNGAFLGAVVPAGEHGLEWVYAPRSWVVGWLLAGFGLLFCGGLSWLGWRLPSALASL